MPLPAGFNYQQLGQVLVSIGHQMAARGLSFGAALDGDSNDEIAAHLVEEFAWDEDEAHALLDGLGDDDLLLALDRGLS